MQINRREQPSLIHCLNAFALKLKYEAAATRLATLALKTFHPDQPRVPAGNPDGGQWTLVGRRPWPMRPRRPVDLVREDAKGGHAVERHVGKSDEYLRNRIVDGFLHVGNIQFGDWVVGSFNNLREANYYVNQTINDNAATVDIVRSGKARQALLMSYFTSPVGYQIFIRNIKYDWTGEPSFEMDKRVVTGVLVKIIRDSGSHNGFRVETAYPITEEAEGND